MNVKMIRYILAKMLGVEALLLLVPALVGLLYGEVKEAMSFAGVAVIVALIYVLFGLKKPEKSQIYGKDGMVVVASAWIL